MSGRKWGIIKVSGVIGIGLGLWGTLTTLQNLAMGVIWAGLHGVETPTLLSSTLMSISLNTLPYVVLCVVGVGSLRLRLWAWRLAVFFVPTYLFCDAVIVRMTSFLPEDWFDWVKVMLPAILFSVGSVWLLTRSAIRAQFATHARK